MVLLSAEKKFAADEIADIVRESSVTVLRWLHQHITEGIQDLLDAPRSGRSSILTRSYLKNGKLAHKPELGASQWILQTNNGQW